MDFKTKCQAFFQPENVDIRAVARSKVRLKGINSIVADEMVRNLVEGAFLENFG